MLGEEETGGNPSIDPGTIETTEVPEVIEASTEEAPIEVKEEKPLTRVQAIKKAIDIQKGKVSSEKVNLKEQSANQVSPVTAPILEAPKSWPAKLKSTFSKLSPEEQKEITQWQEARDRDIQTKFSEYGEKAKTAEKFHQVKEEYRDYFRAVNQEPEEGIKNLIQADQYLHQDPIGAIKWLMEAKGVTLQHLQSNRTYPQRLNHQTVALNDRLSNLEKMLQSTVEAEKRKSQSMIESEIESFINAKDDSGSPLRAYLHDEELKADIGRDMEIFAEKILNAHPKKPLQQVLDEAYTKAVRANDVAWEREQKKQNEVSQKTLQQKARAAKTAGSSVRGAPVGSPEFMPQGKSRRDVIAHLWNQHKHGG